jgi:hypothetical protein
MTTMKRQIRMTSVKESVATSCGSWNTFKDSINTLGRATSTESTISARCTTDSQHKHNTQEWVRSKALLHPLLARRHEEGNEKGTIGIDGKPKRWAEVDSFEVGTKI